MEGVWNMLLVAGKGREALDLYTAGRGLRHNKCMMHPFQMVVALLDLLGTSLMKPLMKVK
jgi:hypothetical protein